MTESAVMKHFTTNVRREMKDKGWTVAALAEAIGTKQPGLSAVLNGHEGITLARAERIADALGVPLSELVEKPRYPQPA